MKNTISPTKELPKALIKVMLTSREQEVLRLIAQGYNADAIGKELFISPWTVKTHRKNLLMKYDAKNSCHLVYKALSNTQNS